MSGKTMQKLTNAGAAKCFVPFGDGKAVAWLKDGKLLAWDRPDGKFWLHKSYR